MQRIGDLVVKAVQLIEREELLHSGDFVLIGLSGGADSIALAHFLKKQGYPCMALHCNFNLRGKESDRDEAFVKDFCEQMQLPLRVVHFDTVAYAKEHKLSIEMAARELRYSEFEKVLDEGKCSVVAVGHHRDDSVETVLLNLVRGSGIRGLRGILPRNGRVIRPLLNWSKEDILYYIEKNSLNFVTDSSNLSSDFKRNFVRNELLPMMSHLNPSIKDALERTAINLRETERFIDGVLEPLKADFALRREIEIEKLKRFSSPEFVLFELLFDYGFNRTVVKDIASSLNSLSGKVFYAESYRLLKDRDYLFLETSEEKEEASVVIENEQAFVRYFELKNISLEEFNQIDKRNISPDILYIDMEQLFFPLVLRGWEQGDTFIPFGMSGSKKVSDFFSNMKMPLFDKKKQRVLQNGDGRIIWLVGLRADNRFRVGSTSKRIVSVEYRNKSLDNLK